MAMVGQLWLLFSNFARGHVLALSFLSL
jgi:hypothetical protein